MKQKKMITVVNKSNCCQYCQFRKEEYKTVIPQECKECGHLNYRDKPYTMDLPISISEEE